MKSITFAWDPDKEKAKRGIAIEEARTVFLDEAALLIPDPDHGKEEDRFILLGLSQRLRLLLVCHCYRQEAQVIRIISARKANRAEAKQYPHRGRP